MANGDIDPSAFYYDRKQGKLYLHRSLDNRAITPEFLRKQIEAFGGNVVSTSKLWAFTKQPKRRRTMQRRPQIDQCGSAGSVGTKVRVDACRMGLRGPFWSALPIKEADLPALPCGNL